MKPQKFSSFQLFQEQHQLEKTQLFWNLSPEILIDHSLELPDVRRADSGAIAVYTGRFTGRSPENRFIVRDEITESRVDWSSINIPFSKTHFEQLYLDMMAYIQKKELYIQQVFVGGQQAHRLGLTVATELPWSSLFVHNMFLSPSPAEMESFQSEWSVFCIPSFEAHPARHGTYAPNFSLINFSQKMILMGGTAYTGEIKKGIFSVLNFLFPTYKNTLPMHCSANVGTAGDTALFFGLSGTGKTTLSSCAHRKPLFRQGILATALSFPVVPKNESCVRIQLHAGCLKQILHICWSRLISSKINFGVALFFSFIFAKFY